MTPLTDTNLQITVVKGLYTDKEDGRWSPIYELDSQEHITAIGLQLNTMVDIGYSPAAFLEDHPHASFAVTYGDNETHWNGFDTEAEATAWLNRPEVQTAGKILESTSDL